LIDFRDGLVRQGHVVGHLVRVWFTTEVDDGSVVDVDRGVDGLQELALLLVPVERRPEGSVTVDSLLEGPCHPIRIDGSLGVHRDEITPMGTHPNSPALVVLELGECVRLSDEKYRAAYCQRGREPCDHDEM